MNSDVFEYQPLEPKQLQSQWEKHKIIIESFIKNKEYIESVYVDEDVVMAIIAKVHQRRKYFEYFHKLDMSECKEIALIAFWYIKLRPVCAISKSKSVENKKLFSAINEKLAIYYIITSLEAMLEERKLSADKLRNLSKKYIRELVYSFRYRDISKEAMILLVESMAIFLGIDPYK